MSGGSGSSGRSFKVMGDGCVSAISFVNGVVIEERNGLTLIHYQRNRETNLPKNSTSNLGLLREQAVLPHF